MPGKHRAQTTSLDEVRERAGVRHVGAALSASIRAYVVKDGRGPPPSKAGDHAAVEMLEHVRYRTVGGHVGSRPSNHPHISRLRPR